MNDMNEIRRLSAIMFTDIVGYSAVMNRNELAAIDLLENHKKITTPIVENYNGKILKPQGDGFMIEFSSVVDAVRCAMGIQKEISNFNTDKNEDEEIRLRIGIHMGDLLIKDNDIYGNDVNIASRIEKLSDPGGICISQTVYDQIKNKVEIETLDLGETELKNIKDRVNIYKVLLEAQEKTDDGESKTNIYGDDEWATPENNKDREKKPRDESEDDNSDIKEIIKKKIKESIGDKIPNININIKNGGDEVKIGPTGIKVKDKDGTNVEIGLSGIKVNEKDGTNVEIGLSGIKVNEKNIKKEKKTPKKKISKLGKAIVKLISGTAFLVLIIGLFIDLYDFWPYGVIYFFSIAISGSSLKTLLKHNLQTSIIKLMSGGVFIIIITGLFTDLYSFWPYGVIGAIALAILIGSLKSLFGEDYDYIDKDVNKKN